MSEEVIEEGISLADRMTRLTIEPTFTDGGHAEGTDGYNNALTSFNASHVAWTDQKTALQVEIDAGPKNH